MSCWRFVKSGPRWIDDEQTRPARKRMKRISFTISLLMRGEEHIQNNYGSTKRAYRILVLLRHQKAPTYPGKVAQNRTWLLTVWERLLSRKQNLAVFGAI